MRPGLRSFYAYRFCTSTGMAALLTAS